SNCTTPGCGNGVVDPGEACDDGNSVSGDGCEPDCTPTPCDPQSPPECQGSILVVCQNGALTHQDCGIFTCNTADGGFCGSCGDGGRDPTGEECDDGNNRDGDGCTQDCSLEFCGDGVINNITEVCDDGSQNSDTPPDACRTDCRPARCGDG